MDEFTLEPKHKVFLSHSGAQKNFVEQLCVDLERCDRYAFFDLRRSCLPIGRNFPKLIFEAIEECEVGVVVLSEEFFTSKWPMLELVAMTKNAKLVIIPVFLGLSLEQCRDRKCQKKWISIWRGWVGQEMRPDRKIDIEEWCGAVRALRPVNSLIYDGGSEVGFRQQIVKAVCDVVLPEARYKDSHVHGRSRLSQVACNKIDEAKVSQKYGVRVVGLYGVGGIGKTTICQTLCNEYSRRMQGRVFHVELGGVSDIELLQGALKRLTDKSHEFICRLGKSQCEDLLKREMRKQPIFLAIDNMSDTTKFIAQANYFLSAGFSKGSIVVVTARSLDVLKLGLLDMDESNCHEMPELLEDEAKSLFLELAKSCHKGELEIDEEIIGSCLKRCYFGKGDGKSYHYHPLALKVLGTQLGCIEYDQNKWATTLKELDTFNQLREQEHSIFSILGKSFDNSILSAEDQMLFMDVALFLPNHQRNMSMTWFDWLSMVHSTSVDDIMKRLEGLKKKSLLQDLGDGRSTKIGMHDLWHEFAMMESKAGKFKGRRWVYEVGSWSALEEGSPSRGFWQNMKRMCFFEKGLESAKSINFDHFSNITVMKMVRDPSAKLSVNLRMDMRKLKHLKSMELFRVDVEAVGLGLLENLRFLTLSNVTLAEAVVDDIGHLTNLQVLVLVDIKGERLPDVRKLISLEEVHFTRCKCVTTISGFSSRLSKLRILNLIFCGALRRLGPGIGDLVALHELDLSGCVELEELPNLQKLSSLRTLNIPGYGRIESVPGLDKLVALEHLLAPLCWDVVELPNLQNLTSLRTLEISFSKLESLPGLSELVALRLLRVRYCHSLAKLPDMRKLMNLQVLDLQGCPLESVPGMGLLTALQELAGDFNRLPEQPDFSRYSLLRDLCLIGCSSQEVFVRSLVGLSLLVKLSLRDCMLGDKMLDCQSLNRLREVEIYDCDFKDVSALSCCTALEMLHISGCSWLERLPNLHKLSRLELLSFWNCHMLRDVHCSGSLSQLKRATWCYLPLLTDIPDLRYFPQLGSLYLADCAELVRLECTGPLVALTDVILSNCPNLISMPDMSHFPTLLRLGVEGCDSLLELTCSGPLTSLIEFKLTGVRAIPELSNFHELRFLEVNNCEGIMELTCIGALTSLRSIELTCCHGVKAIPDLSNFPQLGSLKVSACGSLLGLTCTGNCNALEELVLGGCRSVYTIPDLCNFLRLKVLRLTDCESLTELACSRSVAALEELDLGGCQRLNSIPDLVNFHHLKKLCLRGCDNLQDLTCTGPLTGLKELNLVDYLRLKVVPEVGNFLGLGSL